MLRPPWLLVLLVLVNNHRASLAFTRRSNAAFRNKRLALPRLSSTATEDASSESSTAVNPTHEASGATVAQTTKKRVSILVCPAQFCVPDDYDILFENLSRLQPITGGPNEQREVEIGTCRVAPLPRTEWIKVARQLPTRAFLQAELPVLDTLKWYFDAIDKGVAEIFAREGPDAAICFVGHSIGGWVARAYLGGLGQSSTAVYRLAAERCSSLITLGTPHVSPDTALLDQTRGLLRAVDEAPGCRPGALADRGIDVACVCSGGLRGNFATADLEEFVAASSYFPLLGRIGDDVTGDGIVPLDLAFMESPAKRVVVEECLSTQAPVRHSHVVPTPWNLVTPGAPSIVLPESYVSYISEGVLRQWAPYIQ